MQSLLLPAPWFSKTHFGPHRFDIDPVRVSLHLRPPSTGPKASLGASYSAFPMSGNLPIGTQSESADTTERGEQALTAESASSVNTTHPNPPPRLPTLIPVEGPIVTQASQFLSTEDLLANPTTQVPGISSTVSLSHIIPGSPQIHGLPAASTVRALPPRSTRRAKAHVASACVNCKRKHLGCDSARPCRRCVLSGKASTCVDVTHKKRGRPPLKAEETSLRAVPPLESSVSSREPYSTATGRGPGHSKSSSREIRPITDLQYPRPLEQGAAGLSSGLNPMAVPAGGWQPFTSPQIMPAGHSQRPMSSSGPPTLSSVNYTHSSFAPYHGMTYSPSTGASEIPTMLTYSDRPPAATPTVSPQQYQQNYPTALQSHISPQTPNRALDTAGPSMGLRDPYNEPTVRLPPILPSPPTFAPRTSGHSHRRSDSYPNVVAYQNLHSPQLEFSSQVGRPQESPRSMLELRSPFPAIPGPQNMIPAHPSERSPQIQIRQSQSAIMPTTTQLDYDRRRKNEADNEEENPQPAKRRRMAVDDIVND